MEYHLTFLFEKPMHYNLSIIQEFYANIKKEPWSKVVTIQGVEVNITPVANNRALAS